MTVIALWGTRRDPGAENATSTPSNVDKGIRELKEDGYDVVSIYPSLIRAKSPALFKKILGSKVMIAGAVPALLEAAKVKDSVTYTSDIRWAVYCGVLKRLGLLKRPTITYWAGFDVDFDALKRPSWKRFYYGLGLAGSDICRMISAHEVTLWQAVYPKFADRMTFHPTAVDMAYYEPYRRADWSAEGQVVVIGDDIMRDWDLPIALAERGYPITILSSNKGLKARVDALAPEVAQRIQLIQRAGFARSAEVAAKASCLLLATRPNDRFSGATTVGVAVALRRPLVLDEPYDLAAYGLEPGVSCEYFQRGDVDSAAAAIDKVLRSPPHAQTLIDGLAKLTERLAITDWVKLLKQYIQTVGK